jgi:3-hydroxyisobutyrate dehydrogenase-like beta-hydroxyacid dehydrogenase
MRDMAIERVGLLSPGDMGHSIGNVLRHGGLRVITCLRGRSARSAALAQEAGIEVVADDEALVRQADVLLSVLPPDQALDIAERVANAVRATGTELLFADCNAISPNTARQVAAVVEAAGAGMVDVGIIGNPPEPGPPKTRLYASGSRAEEFAALSKHGLDVRVMGDQIGQASGIKMCYASLTKGLNALATELLTAGRMMDVEAPLLAELEASQPMLLGWIQRQVPSMPPKAYRWVGEMLEIASTYEDLGLTPRILQGAADMFALVENTPLGQETPEHRSRGTTVKEVVTDLAEAIRGGTRAPAAAHS